MLLLRSNLEYCLKENLNCSYNGRYVRVHIHTCIPSEKVNIVVDFIILSEWEERPSHHFDLVKSASKSCYYLAFPSLSEAMFILTSQKKNYVHSFSANVCMFYSINIQMFFKYLSLRAYFFN